MAPLTITGVELREASGEGFSTIVKSGTLTLSGPPAAIEVDGNQVALVTSAREPFKRIGRDFKFATDDVMGFLYVSLPAGLKDEVYDHFEACLEALAAGNPLPSATAAPAPAPAAAAAAAPPAAGGAPAASAAAGPPAGGGGGPGAFMAQLKELGAKAAQDTQAVLSAIKAKAEHDIASLQEKKPAGGAA